MSEGIDGDKGGFRWALRHVLRSWKKHRPKQFRDVLPPEFSSGTLRYIRIHACRNAAPTTIECAKWSSAEARALNEAGTWRVDQACARTGEFVCDSCKHPVVTSASLIERLGLATSNVNFSDRTLRRYLNDAKPMTPAQLRTVVANALGQGWLNVWQVFSLWRQIDQLQAVQRGLRVMHQRVSERRTFIASGEFDVPTQEFADEFALQQRLLDHDSTRAMDERLQANDLPPEVRALLIEVLSARGKLN